MSDNENQLDPERLHCQLDDIFKVLRRIVEVQLDILKFLQDEAHARLPPD